MINVYNVMTQEYNLIYSIAQITLQVILDAKFRAPNVIYECLCVQSSACEVLRGSRA